MCNGDHTTAFGIFCFHITESITIIIAVFYCICLFQQKLSTIIMFFYIKMVRKTFRHLKLGVNQLDETRDM